MNIAKLTEAGWNLLVLLGVMVVAYGCWLAWKPAGFMVGGLAVILIGLGGGVEQLRSKQGSRR